MNADAPTARSPLAGLPWSRLLIVGGGLFLAHRLLRGLAGLFWTAFGLAMAWYFVFG